jgi:hypothetical protein
MEYCPYLGLETDKPFSDDHIFPDMLGGKLDFGLRVSAEANSHLGTRIEGPAFDGNMIFRDLRRKFGIKGRGGIPSVALRGPLGVNMPQYELIHKPDGEVKHNLLNRTIDDPVPDQTGAIEEGEVVKRSGTVYEFAGESSTLDAIMKAAEAKGLTVRIGADEPIPGPSFTVQEEIDTLRIRQALAKIVYATACKWLVDYAKNDPQAPIFRSFFMEENREVAAAVPLNGSGLIPNSSVIGSLLPELNETDHAVFIFCDGSVLSGGVTIFGKGVWNCVVLVSERCDAYKWSAGDIQIAVCDSIGTKTEILTTADLAVVTEDGKLGFERKLAR